MTSRNTDPQGLQIRSITRQQVQQSLATSALCALLLSACDQSNSANNKVPAVFYENTEQCQADIKQQQDEYAVLNQAFQAGKLSEKPTPPVMAVTDCEAQMSAARQEHGKHAPVYATAAECQAEGVQCEATPSIYHTAGYRPVFGGSYFYPYGGTDLGFVYINLGGTQHRVYQPQAVYRSSTHGAVVTPNGQVISRTAPGRVTVPKSTTLTAPPRPPGLAAKGTIKGRSSSGFGSTYKSTGNGGK